MSVLNNPFDPARDVALVTGAGNGIGRAIAQALVGDGLRTVFADVRQDTVAAAAAEALGAGLPALVRTGEAEAGRLDHAGRLPGARHGRSGDSDRGRSGKG